jgi:hypothetical protein
MSTNEQTVTFRKKNDKLQERSNNLKFLRNVYVLSL